MLQVLLLPISISLNFHFALMSIVGSILNQTVWCFWTALDVPLCCQNKLFKLISDVVYLCFGISLLNNKTICLYI